MRINRSQMIEGLPALTARDLMRAYCYGHGLQPAMKILGVNKVRAKDVILAFSKAGYLEVEKFHDVAQWRTTIKGSALAQASLRIIKRETAERQLRALIERTKAYNADPDKLYSVKQLIVFGSYLDVDKQELGDLDIAVSTVRRFEGDDFMRRNREFSNNSGRNFKSYFDWLCWADTELYLYLKGRTPGLNITTEDISKLTGRYQCVYRLEDDLGAIKLMPIIHSPASKKVTLP